MQKRHIVIFVLMSLLSIQLPAQTLEQLARQNFLDGKYAEAKPQFKRCLKTAPRDSRINYWYGACCIETGEVDEAYSYLQFAVDKKVQNAYRYMARYHYLKGHYAEAAENLETYLGFGQSDDKTYAEAQQMLLDVQNRQRFMRRVEKVVFIDSIVVDKASFLDAYHLGSEAGSIYKYNDYYQKNDSTDGTVFLSEMGNKIYLSCPTDSGRTELFSSYRMTDEWSAPQPLQGLPDEGDNCYPFMLPDGITFYFANNGSQSIGGWDIFVTRYNSESDRFLRSDNVGMPFNSEANDYMMAIDEMNGVGWFASDRRQPEGQVCIYSFIWNEGRKEYYDTDNCDPAVLRRAADIASISETQTDEDAIRKARQNLFKLSVEASTSPSSQTVSSKGDFVFVIDDFTDYHQVSDFKNPEAKALCEQYLKAQKELESVSATLTQKRKAWESANASSRTALSTEILSLEAECERLFIEVRKLELQARNTEKQHLSK